MPIVREADGKWVSIRLMEDPMKALTQSYTRTKAANFYPAFRLLPGAQYRGMCALYAFLRIADDLGGA